MIKVVFNRWIPNATTEKRPLKLFHGSKPNMLVSRAWVKKEKEELMYQVEVVESERRKE